MTAKERLTEGVEHVMERFLTKRMKRDFLGSAGPFLLVVTFIEDGLRIFLRWSEQMHYMTAVMKMRPPLI